jgi:Protein of unknown function (DUF4065)
MLKKRAIDLATVRDVLSYICTKHPNPLALTINHINKIIYLADWKSAIVRGRQVTGLTWRIDDSGPHAPQINTVLEQESAFELITSGGAFRIPTERLQLRSGIGWKTLDAKDKEILDFVLKTASSKYFGDFVRLVYSTFPVLNSPDSDEHLDLVALAAQYKEQELAQAEHV